MTNVECGSKGEGNHCTTAGERGAVSQGESAPQHVNGSFLGCLLLLAFGFLSVSAAPLSNPTVDNYDVRVGTETFAALYKFTSNTVLVETAQAITNLGS